MNLLFVAIALQFLGRNFAAMLTRLGRKFKTPHIRYGATVRFAYVLYLIGLMRLGFECCEV
jgi:hypothetical protein